MSGDQSATPLEALFDALRDEVCRDILAALDDPRTAQEVADVCDLPQTSTYRKIDQLCEAGLVEERTEVRPDGHHASTYVRDFSGVLLTYEEGEFSVETVPAEESADERLARLWSRIGDEL